MPVVTFDDLAPVSAAPAGKTFDPAAGITIRPMGGAPEPTPAQAGGNVVTFDDLLPQAPSFDERFAPADAAGPSSDKSALRSGLNETAQRITSGAPNSPSQQIATDFSNILPAASQGTTPNVDAYKGRLISADTFEDDGGSILYRDPQTGQVVPTDTSKQVAIRDPADGVVKIFERSAATNESPVVGVSRVLAPGLSAGAPTTRPAIAAVNIQPKASDIFATAKPYYRAFTQEASKIEVPAETATGIADRVRRSLEKANFIPELASPVYSAVGILDKGQPVTLDALQNVKRVVGRSFNSPDKNIRDAASVASAEIGKVIGEVSKSASQNLKTGDQIHATARSLQDLQRKRSVADLRAGRAGYGGNAVNSMRQVLSPIVQKAIEGRLTGFKPDEIQAMRDIVEGTTVTNNLRAVGQLSPSKGIIQTVGAGGAYVAAGPAALAIPALGASANKLATILTGKQIDRLSALVAKRSPAYAQAVAKAIERYARSQSEFASKPGPNKLAAYISASRALASGLQKDGIKITSGDLLKLLQSPVQSAAEQDHPEIPREPSE